MRDFLLNNGLLLVWALVIIEALIGILCLRKSKSTLTILSGCVCFGLTADALIMALGTVFGEGSFLQGLSQIRYILHGILVPLLIPIAFYTYGITRTNAKRILWIVTGIIMVAGTIMGIMIQTKPELMAGVLRYTTAESTPAFAKTMDRILSFGGVIPLMIVGLAHLIRHKKPWLFLAGLSMFAFAALAPATHNMDLNFLLTMIGEALMVLFFYIGL